MGYDILYEKVEAFIQMDEVEQAVIFLVKCVKNRQTIAFSARLENLRNATFRGTISKEAESIERCKIRDSILSYCHHLKNETQQAKNNEFDEEKSGVTDGGNILTDVKTIEIDIKINKDFNAYSAAEQEKLLSAIKHILEIKGDIKIKQMRQGSVILTLEMTPAQCERLHWAIQRGDLDEFDVLDSEIIEIKQSTFPLLEGQAIQDLDDIYYDKQQKIIEPVDTAIIRHAYSRLLKSIKSPLNTVDHNNIRAAFELAAHAHQIQRRESGEPYITHPIEVAQICVEEIGLGPTAVVCALLHDVVENTDVSLKEIYEQFGEKIALIVDGLTKLNSLHNSESPQAETLSKVLKAMLFDVRIVLIKMADLLHNLRTIKSMPQHKQLKISAETSFIYTPLAHRLGLYAIKNEFQDICLKITDLEVYREIASKLSETKRSRQAYIDQFTQPLIKSLDKLGLPYEIVGRPKTIFSIYNKIKTKHVPFEDIYDLFAVRIVLDVKSEQEKSACWQVYSTVTDTYLPIPQRLKDWISIPKVNGYESLHVTVVGPEGRYIEVQIRSKRMDDIAERGFAAHWKYKGIKGANSRANNYENWLNQVRESLENEESVNTVEFLADFQSNLFAEEVHVFTPKGAMKILPDGATALDFAFSIHSDIGCTCRVVRVNNRIVPFTYRLENGDQVEIITDKNQKPSDDWLQYVVTSKAKNRIHSALKEVKREQAAYGKDILGRKLNAFKVPVEENCDLLAKFYGFQNRMEFLSAIYLQQVDLRKISKHFRADGIHLIEKQLWEERPPGKPKSPVVNIKSEHKPEVYLNGEPGGLYKYSFAGCCNPIAGDDIFGFILVQGDVKIHRVTCPNASNLYAQHAHRILRAEWDNISKNDFIADIVINGIDIGSGVISQLTNTVADLGINIRSFSISGEGGYFEGRLGLIVANIDQLNNVMSDLKSFEWVINVVREGSELSQEVGQTNIEIEPHAAEQTKKTMSKGEPM